MKHTEFLSLVGFLVVASGPVSMCAAADHNFAYWEPEIAAFEQMDRAAPPPQGALLFIGSSTIVGWKTLAQDFPKHRVINRGFGGSQIVDSTYFAERIIFPYKPRMVFLRAGINDINAGKSPVEVLADFKAFEAKVHATLTEAEVVFISLSPTIAFWSQADQEKEANRLIEQFIRVTPRTKYIETYDLPLGPDGKPRPELFTSDKLHFNAAGFKLLADRVRPYLPPVDPPPASPGIRVDGNNASVTYSGAYVNYSGSQWYNTTMRLIDAANGYAQLTFTGTSIKWFGIKQFNLGIADVYLDGVRIQAGIDTYNTGTVNTVELFSRTGLANTSHTIKVVETGTKNPSSTGSRIPVDYFEYSGGVQGQSLVANNDAYGTLEDSTLTVAAPGVLGNDTGSPLSAVLINTALHGSLTLNSSGSFSYTPAANYSGSDSFSYKANRENTASGVATVNLTVTSVNDPPSLNSLPNLSISQNAGLQTVNLSGITAGGGETQVLSVSASSSNPGLIADPVVTYANPSATGRISFFPAANGSGTATISVQVKDAGGTANGGSDRITRDFLVTVVSPTPITPRAVAKDFNGDGFPDIVFENYDGFVGVWFMSNGSNLKSASTFNPNNVGDSRWRLVGTGDFNNDDKTDLLYQHEDGTLAIWCMDGINMIYGSLLNPSFPGNGWHAVATGDINRDNKRDIIFQHDDGTLAVWYMDGINLMAGHPINPAHAGEDGWRVVGTAELTQVGSVDLVFQHTDGRLVAWLMNGLNLVEGVSLNPDNPGDVGWRVAGTVDLNRDGKTDLLFQHDDGSVAAWFMNGINLITPTFLNPPNSGGSGWRIVGPR